MDDARGLGISIIAPTEITHKIIMSGYRLPYIIFSFLLLLLLFACQTNSQTIEEEPPPLKLLVSNSGVYKIEWEALENAGWHRDLDTARLRLFFSGNQLPVWVDGQGEERTISFYAEAPKTRFSSQSVYWLVYDITGSTENGEQDIWEEWVISQATTDYLNTRLAQKLDPTSSTEYETFVHLEDNQLYIPKIDGNEHWYWLSIPAPSRQDFEVTLSSTVEEGGWLELNVWGNTEAEEVSPDHHIIVSINEQQVADDSWDGRGQHTIQVEIQAGLVRDGVNIISIEAPGDTGVAADITLLDWIEINYMRNYVAENDRLEFISQGDNHQLSGFSNSVVVYDISDPNDPSIYNGVIIENGNVRFEGIADHRYLVLGAEGFLSPEEIIAASVSPDLRAAKIGANYVAIGPPDLLEPLQPLLNWRESQGLRVAAIPFEAVYDQFSLGIPDPEAIRAFLRYANANWDPAPKYLLLVGDATYDPMGYVSTPDANRLPTFLLETRYGGETGSDVIFSQLDDDGLPDIAVGRFPARQAEQVRVIVDKILAYEKELIGGDWQERILAVADKQESYFQKDAQDFLDLFPANFQNELIIPGKEMDDPETVITRMREGNLLVAYFGHGSINMWGKDQIFTSEDVSGVFSEQQLPIVMTLTCLNGMFLHPSVDSLAETLLWERDGGAVAVLAPTSLTKASHQESLSHAFVENLLDGPEKPIGDILLAARREVLHENPSINEVMLTFLLFGDPALQVAYP